MSTENQYKKKVFELIKMSELGEYFVDLEMLKTRCFIFNKCD